MKHVFWVEQEKVAGRPGPIAAPWRLEEFRSRGFDVILSVASDLFPHSCIAGTGLSRACIPFPDVVPPDARTISLCRANLLLTRDLISASVEQGLKVLVHCAGGKDRTGLVLAHYIAEKENLAAPEAIGRLRSIRPEALSAEGWEDMALQLIDNGRTPE